MMMVRRRGIAIVSALFILLAVFTVGVGATFVAQMNLGIAVNVRGNSVAMSNAESGLDAAIVELEKRHLADGSFPTSLVTTSVAGVGGFTSDHAIDSYTRLAPNVAVVSVVGREPSSNAEHVSEASVRMIPGASIPPIPWKYGLASEATCTTNGISQFLNAGIHCNAGFNLGNRDEYGNCLGRDDEGRCTAFETIPINMAPVSASPGATVCSPRDLCEGGVPRFLIDPVEIIPDYIAKRDVAITAASRGPEVIDAVRSEIFGISCDVIVSTVDASLFDELIPGRTVCVESNADIVFPDGFDLQTVNLLTLGNVVTGSGANVRDSTIVSMLGSIESASQGNADVSFADSAVFSQGDVRFNGQHSSFSGITTIASAGSLTLNGGSPATTGPDGELGIGLVLVAEGDVEVNGNSDWFVGVLAGGTFTQNGDSTLYGNVASKEAMTFNGGVDVDSGLPMLNPGGDKVTDGFVDVMSRR